MTKLFAKPLIAYTRSFILTSLTLVPLYCISIGSILAVDGSFPVISIYSYLKISNTNESLHKVDVWLGKENSVDVYTNQDIYKTIKKAKKKLLKVSVKYEGPVEAPIKKDEKVAILKVVYDDELIGEYDLLAAKEVKKVNFVSRLMKSLNYLIWGDV